MDAQISLGSLEPASKMMAKKISSQRQLKNSPINTKSTKDVFEITFHSIIQMLLPMIITCLKI